MASGIVALVGWAVGGPEVFGALLVAAALIPLGDMTIVLWRGGSRSAALGTHGVADVAMATVGTLLLLA